MVSLLSTILFPTIFCVHKGFVSGLESRRSGATRSSCWGRHVIQTCNSIQASLAYTTPQPTALRQKLTVKLTRTFL